MGKKTRTIEWIIDDLTGDELPEGEGQTISFAIDGRAYEIDLSDDNAERLRSTLAPYVEKGRRDTRGRAAKRSAAPSGPTPVDKSGEVISGKAAERIRTGIRTWANDNGFQQNATGRIKEDVLAAYYAAHPEVPDVRPPELRVSA